MWKTWEVFAQSFEPEAHVKNARQNVFSTKVLIGDAILTSPK